MEEVRGKHVCPAIDQTAFTCPHCHALARQFWFSVHADPLKADEKPIVATADTVKGLTFEDVEEQERERKLKWAGRMASGRPFLEVRRQFRNHDVQNASISYCLNCNEMCLWVSDQLVWPRRAGDPEPKLHAPPDVPRDADEASQTLDASPRGAAALLRLAVDKVCKGLGESGGSPKDDIAALVQEDLDARVQKVLDAMRIIESNAVPAGQIGVEDKRATAEALFGLVNLICEKMIMEPRHLQALYARRESALNTNGAAGARQFVSFGSRWPAHGCLKRDHFHRFGNAAKWCPQARNLMRADHSKSSPKFEIGPP